jgi:hypothetical protein
MAAAGRGDVHEHGGRSGSCCQFRSRSPSAGARRSLCGIYRLRGRSGGAGGYRPRTAPSPLPRWRRRGPRRPMRAAARESTTAARRRTADRRYRCRRRASCVGADRDLELPRRQCDLTDPLARRGVPEREAVGVGNDEGPPVAAENQRAHVVAEIIGLADREAPRLPARGRVVEHDGVAVGVRQQTASAAERDVAARSPAGRARAALATASFRRSPRSRSHPRVARTSCRSRRPARRAAGWRDPRRETARRRRMPRRARGSARRRSAVAPRAGSETAIPAAAEHAPPPRERGCTA